MQFFNKRKRVLEYSFLALLSTLLLQFSFSLLGQSFSKCNSHVVLACSPQILIKQHLFNIFADNVLLENKVVCVLKLLLSFPLLYLPELNFLHHFLLSCFALCVVISSIRYRKSSPLSYCRVHGLKESVH